MFKLTKGGKEDVKQCIPASRQDWPNHDESMLEFLARKDYEGIHQAGPVSTVICTVMAAVIVLMVTVEVLERGWV